MNNELKQVSIGLVAGFLVASLVLGSSLIFSTMQGWLVVTWPEESILALVWNWTYLNLKESVFIFGIALIFWLKTIYALKAELQSDEPSIESVSHLEHLVDIQAGIFFGIGVIFTAIGMRTALMEALGGLDAASAAEQGAFVMLQKLVDGGILLALSTTILGGIGGYLMRIVKLIMFGSTLQTFFVGLHYQDQKMVFERLDEMKLSLSKIVHRLDANNAANTPFIRP
jgi:hypothetical protein